ncbi:type I polyketide synthase [Spirillospora sp. NPDC052269]
MDWSAGAVELVTETAAWPETGRPRRAAVSSFGISGTNAHVIIEESPVPAPAPEREPFVGVVPWVVSAKSEAALDAQVERLRAFAGEQAPEAVDVAVSLLERTAFDHRAVLLASADGITEAARGTGRVGRLAVVFSGQGAQRLGMGRGLHARFPVFAEAFDEVVGYFPGLREVVWGDDADALNRTGWAQPALFAVEVALFRLAESLGIEPDYVTGHSVGEITAAHVAGVLSLDDACVLVAARARLMQALPEGGAMVAVEATEEEIRPLLTDGVSIAAVNGPDAVVLSGVEAEVLAAVAALGDRRSTRLGVSHAFHSPLLDPMLAEFRESLMGLTFARPAIPLVSNVTGGIASPDLVRSPDYWVRHAREAVRFGDGVAALAEAGVTVLLELGPDGALTSMASRTAPEAVAVAALRKDRNEETAFLGTLARLHVAGARIDWRELFAGADARRVDLPVYAFQRERFWLDTGGVDAANVRSAGLSTAGHPLLAAVVDLADGGGSLFTSRLSASSHPWLADHTVDGRTVVPGTVFVELAIRAGDEVACATVAELTLETPLVLSGHAAVLLQVTVAAPDDDGRREFGVFARGEDPGAAWTRHAVGVLEAAPLTAPAADLAEWPPRDATRIDTAGLYDRLDAVGHAYGPAFQGLRNAWRRAGEVFAEVELPDDVDGAAAFGIHPALLDAALHTTHIARSEDASGTRMPWTWSGVTLHASAATRLRVHMSATAEDTVSLELTDSAGTPVAFVRSVVLRAGTHGHERAALLEVGWTPVPVRNSDSVPEHVVVRCAPEAGEDVRTATRRALERLQDRLDEERPAESRLVFVTERAVAAAPDEDVPDLAHAAVWGLVRSAQTEHPGRFALVDLESGDDEAALTAALATGEPQVAVRGGVPLAPRLARSAPTAGERPVLGPEGTILITGATGALGRVFARHLVDAYGARHLLLAGRRGSAADGIAALVTELEERGAQVTVVACDVADRRALEALLATIPPERPLTAVVHSAGVIDDGVLQSQTPERLDAVLRPKVAAALALHELTRDLPLEAFVLFSSVAGVLGGAGQANYAAANAWLDALAQHRRALGLPATAIAWGLWVEEEGLGSGLGDADRERLRRSGLARLSTATGLAMFDEALRGDRAAVVGAGLDTTAFRSGAEEVPALLRGLVRPARRTADAGGPSLARRLLSLPEGERERVVRDLVTAEVAHVLGRERLGTADAERSFRELGFDSLTAVELRQRLTTSTGLRLPATVAFDHPNLVALAGHVLAELTGTSAPEPDTVPVVPAGTTTADPIAIVAMACRYPGGVESPEELWDLVAGGVDAIGDFPEDRGWNLEDLFDPDPDRPRKSYVQQGGFLRDPAGFDAAFFGMNLREALAADPQQRLLLETSWEAFERAGIDPVSLRGSRTGVFVGAMHQGYASRLDSIPEELEGYIGTGNAGAIISGRLSYTFGFEGPSLTVDTACSSSLVALHLAAQSLRQGECDLALVGGVTVLASEQDFVEFSRQRALSPDGRSRAYAEAANGVAWAEGVGLLAVERLSDAQRSGHPVLAVLRGSAVNQDGASNGLTAPNGPSQQRVIRAALADAGLSPVDVDVVEGHGTGTPLGDPIEAQAILATYGQDREDPLLLGSIKSNIGHTQAAAGAAGVIKMVEAMRRGVVPRTLHVEEPSSHVDWSAGAVELVTETAAWPETGRSRRAAVSSFGAGGTNAHVVLEAAPAPGADAGTEAEREPFVGVVPWVVSAKSEAALDAQVERLRAFAGEQAPEAVDVAVSLLERTVFDHRAVLLASADGITEAARGAAGDHRLGILFSGHGGHRLGMGRGLHARFPVFAEAFDEVVGYFPGLREVVWGDDAERLNEIVWAQPAIFALEVALFRLTRWLGIEPEYVTGHSLGEITAAHVAGVLSLADAAAMVSTRARLITSIPEKGVMVAVEATEEEVLPLLTDGVSIAVINAPGAVVLAGVEVEVLAAVAALKDRKSTLLRAAGAGHSVMLDPILDDYRTVLETLSFAEPRIPMVSSRTGRVVEPGTVSNAEYWVRHMRETVRFGAAVTALTEAGMTTLLELGPDGALAALATRSEPELLTVPALRKDRDEEEALLTGLARLHTVGLAIDWVRLFADARPRRTALPTYAFQRERFWLEPTGNGTGDLRSAGLDAAEHAILGAGVQLAASGGHAFTARISLRDQPWLADHRVDGIVVVPGTALVECALRTADEVGCATLADLTIVAPVLVPDGGSVRLQITVEAPEADGRRALAVHGRADGAEEWTEHATGALVSAPVPAADDLAQWPPPGAEPIAVDDFYARLATIGANYGPSFQGIRAGWRRGDELFTEIESAAPLDTDGFGLHPALFDAAVHSAGLMDGTDRPKMPFSWSGVSLHAERAPLLRVRVTRTGDGTFAVLAADGDGQPVAVVEALLVRELTANATARVPEHLYRPEWVEVSGLATDGGRRGDSVALGDATLGLEVFGHLDALAKAVAAGRSVPEAVLLPIEAPAGTGLAAAARTVTLRTLTAIQDWLAKPELAEARLIFVTRNATAGGAVPGAPAVASARALVRSAQAEHPGRFLLLDLDAAGPSTELLDRVAVLDEPQLAVRGDTLLAQRLVRVQEAGEPLDWGGSVLITGGTGTLGGLVAKRLVTGHGVRRVVLASRRGPAAPGADRLVAELTELGAEVVTVAVDITDRAALATLLAAHPVDSVVHSAAVLADGLVEGMTADAVTTVFEPKVDAAVHLHELTRDSGLRAFVLFSSVAGTLCTPGQGNYAAANGFLDALAEQRRAAGLPATSIAWGLWEETSENTGRLAGRDLQRMASSGMLPMSTPQALAVFDAAVGGAPVMAGARVDRNGLRALADQGTLPAQLRALVPAAARPVRRGAGRGSTQNGLVERVRRLPMAQREQAVTRAVLAETAAALGLGGADAVRSDRDFKELGFDSLTAVELRNRMASATGLRLPASLVFDYPSPRALAAFLLSRIEPEEAPGPDTTGPADARPDEPEPVEEDRIDAMSADDLIAMALGEGKDT